MSLTDDISTPQAISFATNSSCERKPRTFERSASNAPKTRPWSKDCIHFSISVCVMLLKQQVLFLLSK